MECSNSLLLMLRLRTADTSGSIMAGWRLFLGNLGLTASTFPAEPTR